MSEHGHVHQNQKQVLNRLARIEGHVRAVKEMVASGRDCPEVLLQIAAVRKALDNTAKVILKDHLEHCVAHALEEGQQEKALRELQEALDRYLR
ncbi:metal-sensing transcriptional repressor [uncultured Anaeromusa sp.]|uniref:metal-sensing transcriptional repressor n=1 Tax=uncultured Anaeromusa sp. TaxID=673273 RepID=UPI0029C7907A|nr:metal-sensing transcriptional repressor [uncultured Anaeromusa sp.]